MNQTQYGGAENYLDRFISELKDCNIDHKVIFSPIPKFFPSWLRILLFNFQACFFKKNKFYFSLERIICPDIYRAGDGVHKVFLSIERKSKANLLHPIYLFLERKCFQNAKHIIANSKMVKNEIINTYRIESEKISVVYNGIEIKNFNYKQSFEKLSQEFLINKKNKILLFVGSGFERKGVKEFLKIIAKLNNTDIKAFVIGKEKNIENYQRLAIDLKINNQVIFTGPRRDVDDFYIVSDIFILPTHYDPFSNVVLEAMNFENAVFTTKQNGAHEILSSEFIMDSSIDFSVVEKIKKLLSDRETLNKIKKNNRLLSKKFSIQTKVFQTLKSINEVIN